MWYSVNSILFKYYAAGSMQRSTISLLPNAPAMVTPPAFFVVSVSKAEDFHKKL